MPPRATTSATRAVRSIISRLAVVRIRSSVIARSALPPAAIPVVARDRERDAPAFAESLLELGAIDPAHSSALERGDGLAIDGGRLAVDVLVRLDVHRAAPPTDLDRLVGELAGDADGHLRE